MKASNLFLFGSATLNLALLAVIAAGVATNSAPTVAVVAPAVAAAPKPLPGPGVETWGKLQTDNLTAERDRLVAEGFPPSLVRAILGAQIRARYAAQRKALEQTAGDAPYWKKPKVDPKLTAALRDLSRAERKELTDLLGPDPSNPIGERFARQIPGLSAEKAADLAAITQRYSEQRMELYSNGPMSPSDRQKMLDLDKAMHAEYAAVLTPQELENYDLRASRTAQQLQWTLSAFDTSEAEFRALYKLQSAFDEQHSFIEGPLGAEDGKARMEAQKQLQRDIAAALGPDRYAEYQRATDYNYRTTRQLVDRLQLPPETADNLYSLQKEYQQKQQDTFKAMRETRPDPETMRQQLAALQTEATTRVSTVLGGNAAAVEAYKRYGGSWIRTLVPMSRPATPAGGATTTTVISTGP